MELTVIDSSGAAAGRSVGVSDAAFAADFNEPLVHQVVVAFMAGARAGTRAQKTRSDVRGGGRKPWRQKGTGHARAGTIRSPLWRGGGVTFAARPQDHSQKVNRKMYRGAMRSILSELVRTERLRIVSAFEMDAIKTKDLAARLRGMGLTDVLLVMESPDENLVLSARNLHWMAVIESVDVNPLNLLAFEHVLMSEDALRKLEERLQ